MPNTFVTPGPRSPGSVPGTVATESQLKRVSDSNAAVAKATGELKATATALHESVKINTSTIANHVTSIRENISKVTENNSKIDELLKSNNQLIEKIDSFISAVEENSRQLSKMVEVTERHREVSEGMVDAIKKLG